MTERSVLPDATTLAAEHRAMQRDPRDTLKTALSRAQETQAELNAFAAIDAEGAMAQAESLAVKTQAVKTPAGALAGVPISVKDILDVAGFATRWGSTLMAQAKPAASDVAAVARLKAAGAIVIGKTTTTEFAHSPLNVSPLTGVTRNPWASSLTPGGSSAGAGASVAAGVTPVALATDAGCSTRLPAACTGVFGIKPTLGRIPHDRVPEGFYNFVHLGLIARRVRDLALALDVTAGPHRVDPHSLLHTPPDAVAQLAAPVLTGARVLLWMNAGNARVSDEVVAATRAAADALRALGAIITEEPYPFANPNPVWTTLQQSNWAARFASAPAADRAQLSGTFNDGIDAGASYSGLDLHRALTKRTEFFRGVQAAFAERTDFILTPCTSTAPVDAAFDLSRPLMVDGVEAGDLRTEWTPYLALFDLSGHPAIAMPAGVAANGGPLGVQLVAPWARDAALLAAAMAYESATSPKMLA